MGSLEQGNQTFPLRSLIMFTFDTLFRSKEIWGLGRPPGSHGTCLFFLCSDIKYQVSEYRRDCLMKHGGIWYYELILTIEKTPNQRPYLLNILFFLLRIILHPSWLLTATLSTPLPVRHKTQGRDKVHNSLRKCE